MGNRPSNGRACVVGPPASRLVHDNYINLRPGFSALDMIARASVALSIEQSGCYAFPNRAAYEAFIGRLFVGRRSGSNVSAKDARWVCRKLFPVMAPTATAIAQTVVEHFKRLVSKDDPEALKLWSHLMDCNAKPPSSRKSQVEANLWIRGCSLC
jgi:hypothetical protein